MIDVLYCGTGWLPVVEEIRERLPTDATVRVWDPAGPLVEALRDANVVLPSNTPFGREEVQAPRNLLLVQQPAAGYDGIDLAAARARGVPVCNAPGANGDTVAEAALFLMLALARRLPRAQRAFAERRIGSPAGMELRGKVLGIVGLGRIGSRLAAFAEALGMEVIGIRSSSPRAHFDDLLARSDVVSLHCPLTPETRGLLDARAFERMKPGALLVNCARGPIVDRPSLEAALASGKLGGAGLDTYWAEPWDPADPLYARDDVVALPHVGGSTREAYGRIADVVAENVRRLARGEQLLHRLV